MRCQCSEEYARYKKVPSQFPPFAQWLLTRVLQQNAGNTTEQKIPHVHLIMTLSSWGKSSLFSTCLVVCCAGYLHFWTLKKHIQTNFKELVIFQTTHHGIFCSKDKGENVFIHPFSMKRNVLAWIGAKRRLLHFAHNYTGQLLIIFSHWCRTTISKKQTLKIK